MALWRPWFDEVSVEAQTSTVTDVNSQAVNIQPQLAARQVIHLSKEQQAAMQSLMQYMYNMKKAAVSQSCWWESVKGFAKDGV